MLDPQALKEIWPHLTETERKEILSLTAELESTASEWNPLPGPQTMAFESEADIVLFGGSAGGGKYLGINTPIPTTVGWKKMGDICVGDQIFDESGNICNVLVVEPFVIDTTYLVKFSDDSEIIAGAPHKWITETYKDRLAATHLTKEWRARRRAKRLSRSTGKRPDVIAKNIAKVHVYKEIPKLTIKTTAEIANTLIDDRHINHSIKVCSPLKLPIIDLPIDPYILGAWLGDGTSKSGGITGLDPEIFEEIRKAGYVVTDHAERKHKGILKLQVKLKALGVFGNKHIPFIYLRASIEQRLALLQGLMDTDGHCDRRGQCEFYNTNKILIEQAHELICSLGIKVTIRTGRATLNGEDYGEKYRLKFITDLPVFRLPRKLDRQKRTDFRGTHNRRYIVSCDQIDPVLMRCIAVDSPSHLYLAGRSFIPTHNTDLALGKALRKHKRALILRREFPQLSGILERAQTIYDKYGKFTGSPQPIWKLEHNGVKKRIEFGSCQHEKDKTKYQGRSHDLRVLDEAANFLESQVIFLAAWVRSEDPHQKCQLLLASNPPTAAEGQWLYEWFRAWLDPQYPNPALPGELKWYARIKDQFVEVHNGNPFVLNDEKIIYEFDKKDYRQDQIIVPKSRTYIPSRVTDNPYYVKSGYIATLQALDEPLRSLMLNGDFLAGQADDAWQVIPTAWIKTAQQRWRDMHGIPPKDAVMTALGVDPARGGKDKTILTPRYGEFFGQQSVHAGSDTPDGDVVADLIFKHRYDTCRVIIDVIGIGSSVYDATRRQLNTQFEKSHIIGFQSAGASKARDKSKKYGFFNLRAEWYWRMREALDPLSGKNIALPDDRELLADLTAPTFSIHGDKIKVEPKEDIVKRLGRSPDKGDSLIYASVESTVVLPHGANISIMGR
jgi:LAGLIDADG-like domain